jgi:hypothetical protein
VQRKRQAHAGQVRQRVARWASRWRFDLQNISAEVGEQAGDDVGVPDAQIEHPHRGQ